MDDGKSPWVASMEVCGESLRRAWEAGEVDDGSSERARRYVVSFDASPSTAARIRSFIADQPTANRSSRSYEAQGGGVRR